MGQSQSALTTQTLLKERQDAKTRLARAYSSVTADDNASMSFALEQAISAYTVARDRFKNLDAKAATLAGIITTGLGAVSILGKASDVSAFGPLLDIGIVALVLALGFALSALVPVSVDAPRVSSYRSYDVFTDADSVARGKFELAAGWLRDTTTLGTATSRKAARLNICAIAICIGIVFLVLNFLLSVHSVKTR